MLDIAQKLDEILNTVSQDGLAAGDLLQDAISGVLKGIDKEALATSILSDGAISKGEYASTLAEFGKSIGSSPKMPMGWNQIDRETMDSVSSVLAKHGVELGADDLRGFTFSLNLLYGSADISTIFSGPRDAITGSNLDQAPSPLMPPSKPGM